MMAAKIRARCSSRLAKQITVRFRFGILICSRKEIKMQWEVTANEGQGNLCTSFIHGSVSKTMRVMASTRTSRMTCAPVWIRVHAESANPQPAYARHCLCGTLPCWSSVRAIMGTVRSKSLLRIPSGSVYCYSPINMLLKTSSLTKPSTP